MKARILACKDLEGVCEEFGKVYFNRSRPLENHMHVMFSDTWERYGLGFSFEYYHAERVPEEELSKAQPLREYLEMSEAEFEKVFGGSGEDFAVLEVTIGSPLFDKKINCTESRSYAKGITVPYVIPKKEFMMRQFGDGSVGMGTRSVAVEGEKEGKWARYDHGELVTPLREFFEAHREAFKGIRVMQLLIALDFVRAVDEVIEGAPPGTFGSEPWISEEYKSDLKSVFAKYFG